MTEMSDAGQITGTKDKDYNILWFTEACRLNEVSGSCHVACLCPD